MLARQGASAVANRARAAQARSSRYTHRIVVEQHALLILRHVGDDRLEADEDRIEAADQAVDRKIAREHAAVSASVDRVAHDREIAPGAQR